MGKIIPSRCARLAYRGTSLPNGKRTAHQTILESPTGASLLFGQLSRTKGLRGYAAHRPGTPHTLALTGRFLGHNSPPRAVVGSSMKQYETYWRCRRCSCRWSQTTFYEAVWNLL